MSQAWDDLARERGGEHDPPGSLPALVHAVLRRRILAWCTRLPEGARVLDLGCGRGQLARLLSSARPDLKVMGMDFSEAMLEAARAASTERENLAWRRGDARSWPLADGAMDAVLALDLAAHLEPGAEIGALLAEARRVVPSGWLLLEIKTPWSLRLILALKRLMDRALPRRVREFFLGIQPGSARVPVHVHEPKALLKGFELEARLRPWVCLPCPSQVYVLRLGAAGPAGGGRP